MGVIFCFSLGVIFLIIIHQNIYGGHFPILVWGSFSYGGHFHGHPIVAHFYQKGAKNIDDWPGCQCAPL